MMRNLLCSVVVLMSMTAVLAGEMTITVREQLNRRWANELMTYAVQFPQGQCYPGSEMLHGPAGEVAVQFSPVELWPNKSVKSAKLSFIVPELMPQTELKYRLSYGNELKERYPVPQSDLKVTPQDGAVIVTTSRFSARLLIGEKMYNQPVVAGDVPAPVLAMQQADSPWFGGGKLYGKTAVKSWSSKLVANGPVFVRVETTYIYADGNTLTVGCQLNAGDYALLVDMNVAKDSAEDGWDLHLGGPAFSLTGGAKLIGARTWMKEQPIAFDMKATEPAFYLSPWPGDGWFADSPAGVRLKAAQYPGDLLLTVRDSGAWVQPQAEFAWKNFTNWRAGMPEIAWKGWMTKRIPVFAEEHGAYMRMNLLAGERKFAVGYRTDGKRLFDAFQCKATDFYTPIMSRLDVVKEMALDWPDGAKHPYLYLNAQEMTVGAMRNGAAYKDAMDLDRMRAQLDALGNMDLMRNVMDTAARYDALIDSGQLSPEERRLRKAQMVFLCYMVDSPAHWSYERGFISGNPNMTVSRIANLGVAAMAIRENPQGKKWAQYAVNWGKYWLTDVVDDAGQWPESSHYARVSWADYVQLALVARKAGLHDFFKEPKFQAMAYFYEKTFTPPDPLRYVYTKGFHPRVGAPYGRGTRGDTWGLNGLVAAATATSDPAFSRIMQWCWREGGFSVFYSHSTAGMMDMLVDRNLPAERPSWGSEQFPHLGYLLRSHVGDPAENYLLFVSQYHRNADGEIWPADTGTIAKWFANGVPMGGNFHRIPDLSTPLLESRVSLATNWDPANPVQPDSWYTTQVTEKDAALQERADYVRTLFDITESKQYHPFMPKDAPAFPKREKVGVVPLRWERQVLLAKDAAAGGITYLVLRDTVSGKQPSQWHFWSLSEKIGATAETVDRMAFLADKPGAKAAPLRELKGDRFTAIGQFGTDLEYYVASPTATPRFTLRYGYTTGAYGVWGNFSEYQDMLHLQLPGDGTYFVALYPRKAGEAAPAFTTLGNGSVIKVAGTFGTDYCFLTPTATQATTEDAAFDGTVAMVQDRATGLSLILSAPGSVRYREFSLSTAQPATLRVAPYALTLELSQSGTAMITAAGKVTLADDQPGVKLVKKGTAYQVTTPAGITTVRLVRK
jgi:hypothetical protein